MASLFVGVAVPFLFKHVFQKYQADRIFSMVGRDNPFEDESTVKVSSADVKKAKKEKENYNVKQSKIERTFQTLVKSKRSLTFHS